MSYLAGPARGDGSERPGVFNVRLVGVAAAEGFGLSIAVDLSMVLHADAVVKKFGREVVLGNCGAACDFVVSQALLYKQAGVILVFCADNRASAYAPKAMEDEARRSARAAAAAKVHAGPLVVSEAVVSEAFSVAALQAVVMPALVEAGFTVITAPREADPQIVSMWTEWVVDGIWCLDGDVFVHGAERALWTSSFFSPVSQLVQVVHLPSMGDDAPLAAVRACTVREVRLTLLRMFAILAGCDYCKIKDVGPGAAARAVSALYARHVDAGAGDVAAVPLPGLREPHIAGPDGALAQLLVELRRFSPAFRAAESSNSLAFRRGTCTPATGGLLGLLSRSYYAFASAPVYSFLDRIVRPIFVSPPTLELATFVGVTPEELVGMNSDIKANVFNHSAEMQTWFTKQYIIPRYPGAMFADASRYFFGPRCTLYYLNVIFSQQTVINATLVEFLQLTSNTASGAISSDKAGLLAALRSIAAAERNNPARRLPTVRPKDWRPKDGLLFGGPAPSAAQRRRLLDMHRAGTSLPAVYDPGPDIAVFRAADAAAASGGAPIAVATGPLSKRARFLSQFPQALSIEAWKS